jgi:hypothetical protein
MKKLDIVLTLDGRQVTRSLNGIAERLENELNQAVTNLAHATFAKITSDAQSGLHSTRQDYLRGLKFDSLGKNSYLISLQGEWANRLEHGFPAYDMKDVLLNSTKIVKVGSRAGQSWVQKGAKNQRYAHVPFEHRPFSKEAKAGDLNAVLKKMTGYGVSGVNQRITRIFKDPAGNPMEGKVAVGRSDIPELDQVVKYQKIHQGKQGQKTVQSVYVTYRTISDLGRGWRHPGFEGLRAFQEAEKWLEKEIDNVIRNLGR